METELVMGKERIEGLRDFPSLRFEARLKYVRNRKDKKRRKDEWKKDWNSFSFLGQLKHQEFPMKRENF